MNLIEQIKQTQGRKIQNSPKKTGFINIYVGDERLNEIKATAASVSMPVSTFIRALIDVTISQYKEKKDK